MSTPTYLLLAGGRPLTNRRPAPQRQSAYDIDTTGNPATTLPSGLVLPQPLSGPLWLESAWSMVIPGLPWLPGLTSSRHPERCLTWFLGHPLWADWVDKILTAAAVRGYNRFTLSWPDCRAFMSQSAFVNLCAYVRSWGFEVHVKWWSKDDDPWNQTWDQFGPSITPVLQALMKARAVQHVSPWEFNAGNLAGPGGQTLIDGIASVVRPGGVRPWIHFGPVTVWWGDGAGGVFPNRDVWWQYNRSPQPSAGGFMPLDGIHYQAMPAQQPGAPINPDYWDLGLLQAHIQDSTNHDAFVATGAEFILWEEDGSEEFDGDWPDETTSAMHHYVGLCTPGKMNVTGAGGGLWLPDGTPATKAA